MDIWIPAFSGLIGVILGSYISHLTTLKILDREDKSEKRKLIIEKLEEIHHVVRDIRQSYKTINFGISNYLVSGNIMSAEEETLIEIDRLVMLVNFYFPELLPSIHKFEPTKKLLDEVITEVIFYIIKPERIEKELITDYSKKNIDFDNACVVLLDAIAQVARSRFKL